MMYRTLKTLNQRLGDNMSTYAKAFTDAKKELVGTLKDLRSALTERLIKTDQKTELDFRVGVSNIRLVDKLIQEHSSKSIPEADQS